MTKLSSRKEQKAV